MSKNETKPTKSTTTAKRGPGRPRKNAAAKPAVKASKPKQVKVSKPVSRKTAAKTVAPKKVKVTAKRSKAVLVKVKTDADYATRGELKALQSDLERKLRASHEAHVKDYDFLHDAIGKIDKTTVLEAVPDGGDEIFEIPVEGSRKTRRFWPFGFGGRK